VGVDREALTLWRGQTLSDLADAPFVQAETARLEELRLAAVEARADAALALARHDEVIAQLEAMAASYPRVKGSHAG
jgi:DNA-binding SARP family transcriptional activator